MAIFPAKSEGGAEVSYSLYVYSYIHLQSDPDFDNISCTWPIHIINIIYGDLLCLEHV